MSTSSLIMSTNSGVDGSSAIRLTYDFSHDKLRAVALEMVSPARRRQLHRAVAEAIAVERHNDIAASPQLAAHYDQAGMVEPAIDAYRVAEAERWRCRPSMKRSPCFGERSHCSPTCHRHPTAMHSNSTSGSPSDPPLLPSRATAPKCAPTLRASPFALPQASPTRGPADPPWSRPRPAAGLPLRRLR